MTGTERGAEKPWERPALVRDQPDASLRTSSVLSCVATPK